MIGIIVTGHGHFASGIVSALKLLAGEPELLEVVDFQETDSIEILEGHITEAVRRLEGAEGVLIMTDLQGGSPFNVSARLVMQPDNAGKALELVAGVNLPMLVETYMSRMMETDVASLAARSVKAGAAQVVQFSKAAVSADDDEDEIELD